MTNWAGIPQEIENQWDVRFEEQEASRARAREEADRHGDLTPLREWEYEAPVRHRNRRRERV